MLTVNLREFVYIYI